VWIGGAEDSYLLSGPNISPIPPLLDLENLLFPHLTAETVPRIGSNHGYPKPWLLTQVWSRWGATEAYKTHNWSCSFRIPLPTTSALTLTT